MTLSAGWQWILLHHRWMNVPQAWRLWICEVNRNVHLHHDWQDVRPMYTWWFFCSVDEAVPCTTNHLLLQRGTYLLHAIWSHCTHLCLWQSLDQGHSACWSIAVRVIWQFWTVSHKNKNIVQLSEHSVNIVTWKEERVGIWPECMLIKSTFTTIISKCKSCNCLSSQLPHPTT